MTKKQSDGFTTTLLRGLVLGRFLKRAEGARMLTSAETGQMLSRRNKGLVIDGKDGRLTERESFQNVCVMARVGAGKTSRYIIPNVLDRAARNSSIVINDPKGEVFAETSGYLQSWGYKIIALNPEDIAQSSRFNPLLEARSDVEIEQIAEILVKAGAGNSKDEFWNHGAVRLISVLLKLLARAGQIEPGYNTLGNLYYLLQNFGTDGSPLDDFALKWAYDPLNPEDASLWEEWQGAVTGNQSAVQSFALTALTALKAFTNKNLIALSSESSFRLEDIRHQKTAVYFITPPHLAEYYGFWTSVFFRSVFNVAMRKMPDRSTLPLYILYDEFGHSTIPSFVSVANTIRGYRVSLSIVLQSLAQLSARYGKDYAQSIQGAFTTYLAYSGSDQETAQFFEALSGKVIERRRDNFEDITEQRQEYNLMNADAVRRIGDQQALVVSANRNPAIIDCTGYYAHRKWAKVPGRYGAAFLRPANDANNLKRVPLS